MTLPTTRRRRTSATGEVSPDKNPATIVTPTDEPAEVVETVGGKQIFYKANITQDETKTESDGEGEGNYFDDADDYSNQDQAAYSEIPKDPLTVMFDAVREAQQQPNETFIANILRLQDFMNDNFNVPCSVNSQFPPLQFSARDIFTFVSTLQKNNNNSGGRFTIRVYRQDGNPVKVFVGRNGAQMPIDLGIGMLAIPNPTKEVMNAENNNNGSNGQLAQILAETNRQSQESNRLILEAVTRRPEQSEIEKLVMTLAVQKMMNPEAPQNNNILETTMASMFASQQMIEGFARKMFPEPKADKEPDMLDKIERVLELPLVQNAVDGIVNIAETASVNYMAKQAEANRTAAPQNPAAEAAAEYYEQPEPQGLTEAENDMQKLIVDVIKELKSENPLDASNAMIMELSNEFPDQFDMIADACKGMQFDGLLTMMINRGNKITPNPFLEFIDIDASTAQGVKVWTAEGERMKGRLNELYTCLKTL